MQSMILTLAEVALAAVRREGVVPFGPRHQLMTDQAYHDEIDASGDPVDEAATEGDNPVWLIQEGETTGQRITHAQELAVIAMMDSCEVVGYAAMDRSGNVFFSPVGGRLTPPVCAVFSDAPGPGMVTFYNDRESGELAAQAPGMFLSDAHMIEVMPVIDGWLARFATVGRISPQAIASTRQAAMSCLLSSNVPPEAAL